jgi:hypothetical protein
VSHTSVCTCEHGLRGPSLHAADITDCQHAGGAVASVDRLGGRLGSTLGALPEGKAASAAGTTFAAPTTALQVAELADACSEWFTGSGPKGLPWCCMPSLPCAWLTRSVLVPEIGSQGRSRVSSLDMWLPEAAVAPPPPAASPAGPLPQHEVAVSPQAASIKAHRQHACALHLMDLPCSASRHKGHAVYPASSRC